MNTNRTAATTTTVAFVVALVGAVRRIATSDAAFLPQSTTEWVGLAAASVLLIAAVAFLIAFAVAVARDN
jgi:hypothetical protein